MNGLTDAVEMLVVFGAIVAVIKLITDAHTRNKIIQKGLVDEKVKYLFEGYKPRARHSDLKWGLVLMGIGFAFVLRQFLEDFLTDTSIFGLAFLFAGFGFLIYYAVAGRAEAEKTEPSA